LSIEARTQLESEVRAACGRGDFSAAATQALEGLGDELYGFLLATCKTETDASDVFSALSEQLWKGLPKFRWQSSLRTWAYALARHAALDHAKLAGRRRAVLVTADEQQHLSHVAERVRSQTPSYLKTARRSAVDALRASLPEDDQRLLVLRVDRDLQWNELAEIFLGDPSADAAELKKEAARLRKRFQLVKEKLLELGKKQGLFGG
jgi:RNA polymerase sigma-70 factor, ECF subfamily